jgi:MFS family permease
VGRSEARALVPFFAANVLFGAGLFFHAFLYNFYLERLGHGGAVMGAAAAALTAGGLASLLPAGILVDRWGTRGTYLTAAAVASLGLAAGAVAQRPIAIYMAAFVAGAGTATWRVAGGPIIMQLATPAFRSRGFSWNVGLLVAAGAGWMALAGALPRWVEAVFEAGPLAGLRAALLAGAVGTMVAGILFAVGVRAPSLPPDAVTPSRPSLLPRIPRGLALLVILVAWWMLAPALVLPFFNIYFSREHALDIGRIGLIFAATHVATALIVFGTGEAASRGSPRVTLACWMFLFAPVLWGLAAAETVGLAIVLYLVQGFVSPATNPLIDQILLERAPTGRRGAVSSWRNAATEVSGILGASAGGLILEAGSFGPLFWIAGALGLAAAVALTGALKRNVS